MKLMVSIVFWSGLLVSCTNFLPSPDTPEEDIVANTEQPTPVVEEPPVLPPIDTTSAYYPMVERLQGIWRKDTPPFSQVEFKQQAVRFIPTGELPAEPTFEPFEIAATCPYGEVDPERGDFLVLPMGNECLIIALKDDKLEMSYTSGGDMTYYKEE